MKNGYKILWTKEANDNLDSILKYLEENWTEKEIRKFAQKLNTRINIIKQNPKAFPFLISKIELRKSVLTRQTTIYYKVKKDSIVIVALFDNRKKPI